jgi:hypothetical protein
MKCIVALAMVFSFVFASSVHAQECRDQMILAAHERVMTAGIDTTGHWYAISQPFESMVGLIIDGRPYGPYESALPPRFSHDGGAFVAGVKTLGQWSVLTSIDTIALSGDVLYDVRFSALSDVPWWHHANGQDHRLSTRGKTYTCSRSPQMLSLDPSGTVAAWVESTSAGDLLMRNGQEIARGEQLLIAGVWSDGSVVYAVRFGSVWSVFVGTREIVRSLLSVGEFQTNLAGTSCGFHAADATGLARMYVYTADMQEPWMSQPCENISGFVLAPWEPLAAAIITRNGNRSVSFQGTEYPAGQQTGPIGFTPDGSTMMYAGFDGEHFITLNGKQNRVKGAVNLRVPLSIDQTGTSAAWASSTTLAKANLEYQVLRLGKMCDSMLSVVYNRRKNVFQGLGYMGRHLFLLECKP